MQTKMLRRDWVDRLFARLQGVYGREFTGQFSTGLDVNGVDLGIENAKQVWAEELGGFSEWPEAIAYALSHLPERCPNAIRFRDLCRHAPPKNVVKLEHKLTEEQLEENKRRIREITEMLGRKK